MEYLFIIIIACCNYYTYTYGRYMWQKESNKLGGAAAIILSFLATVVPAIVVIRQ